MYSMFMVILGYIAVIKADEHDHTVGLLLYYKLSKYF